MGKIFIVSCNLIYYLIIPAYAQIPSSIVKKVQPEDFSIPISDIGADVVILYESCDINFETFNRDLQVFYDYYSKIRIVNPKKSELAKIRIDVYKEDDKREVISNIDCAIYYQSNNQVVELNSSMIKEEQLDWHHFQISFDFPNIKEECIIEYSYQIRSNIYYRFRSLSKSFPTLDRDYTVTIPEFFDYELYAPFYAKKYMILNKTINGSIDLFVRDYRYSVHNSDVWYYDKIRTIENINFKQYKWHFKNIDFPHSDDPSNSQVKTDSIKIIFTLTNASFQVLEPYKRFYEVLAKQPKPTNWEDFCKALVNHRSFYRRLADVKFLKKEINKICDSSAPIEKKLETLFNYIQMNTEWNGLSNIYTSQSIKNLIKEKIGNSADINFLFLACLKLADIQAEPFIILKNFETEEIYPLIRNFEKTIIYVQEDDKQFLINVTDINKPFMKIEEATLSGVIVSKDGFKFIGLNINDSLH